MQRNTVAGPVLSTDVRLRRSAAHRLVLVLGVLGTALASALPAAAATYTWDGGGADNSWNTAANWSGDVVPGVADDVVLDATSAKDCHIDTLGVRIANLTITQDAYAGTVTVDPGATFIVGGTAVIGGKLVIDGLLQVETTGQMLAGSTSSGELVLNPDSQLVLNPGASFTAEADTSFSALGTAASYAEVKRSGMGGGVFELRGHVDVAYLIFGNMGDPGLHLLSGAGQSVSMHHVTCDRGQEAQSAGSQYMYVNGAAWDGYEFVGMSFIEDYHNKDKAWFPYYAVESAYDIFFKQYDITSANAMYGDAETDPVSTGTVIWEPADLVVVSVVPSNSNPTTGTNISISVTVKNEGSLPAANFPVDLFYNRGSPPSVGESGDETKTVLSLDPGASTVVTFTNITNATAETWNTYAIVDTASVVTEIDTSDNVGGPAQIVWGGAGTSPDLTITAITPLSTTPSAGSTITVNVTVQNQGDAAVGSFRLDLFHHRATAPSPGDTGDQNQTVGGLGIGASTTVTFVGVTSAVPADWSMYAIVDTLNGVAESDEADNVAGPTAVQWQGIDLVITAITPTDPTPLMGVSIDVDVTVQNLGNIAAGGFDVGLFYNEPSAPSPGDAGTNGKATQGVASLAAGATTTVTFVGVTNASAGAWSMYAVADDASPDAVSEYDETNNVSGPVAVTWRASDLIVLSITPSNASPTVGSTISVDVTVKNQGDADAGAFDVGLYLNEPAAPSPGDAGTNGKGTPQNVASLAAGAQTTVTFPGITNGTAETWSMYAVADDKTPPGDVTEADEANNVGGPAAVTWGAAGTSPDLLILSVAPSDTNPAIGEMISVDVTVANQGTADAGGFVVALFNNEAAPPSVGDPADQTQAVASLAQSTQTVVTFTNVTSATTGAWSMYAVADNTDTVTEQAPDGDEANNVSTAAAVTWHAPEIVITAITPSSADPDVGADISVDVTVRNNGDAPAVAFDVGLFYNEAITPSVGDPADETQSVLLLAASAETTVTFAGVTSSASGVWNMYAAVDNGSAVTESDETNNVSGPTTVTWHGPDLVISSVTPSNFAPTTAETISVDVTVINLGDRDAGSFDVALFHNRAAVPSPGDAADQTQNVVSLAAGNTTTVVFAGIGNAVEEVWKTWATVDNGLTVDEGDEANNAGGPATITWGTPPVPDLVVVSIVPSEASPSVPGTISVEVTVRNTGTLDASLFDVGLYYDLAAPPGVGDPADQTKGVGSLAPGAQKVLTFTGVSNATAEIWNMYAFVDSGDVIVESNQGNNTRGPVEVNWGSMVGITVVAPDGGETWESGTTQYIVWDSYGATWANVAIEHSVNGGADWTFVANSTPDDGVYEWDVPLGDSGLCLVRVTSEGGSYSDESDAVFTVTPAGVGKPNLRIVSISPSNSVPNVGNSISVDVAVRNTGNAAAGLFYVDLFYDRSVPPSPGESGDQSKPVSLLAAGAEASVSFANVSSAVPAIWEMYVIVDTQGYVSESGEGDNVAGPVQVGWDTINDSFRLTSPDGGEVFERGQTCPVTWTWTGNPGALVNIEVSTDGGTTWTTVAGSEANDAWYDWTVPGSLPASTGCRLRISNFLGTVSDVSDGVFRITNAVPVASVLAGPTTGTRPLIVSFDGSASSDAEGVIALYEWDFDYGGVPAGFTADATGPTAVHTYEDAGSYTVALRVTDTDGASSIAGATILVDPEFYLGPGCAANATADSGTGWAALPLFVILAGLARLGRRSNTQGNRPRTHLLPRRLHAAARAGPPRALQQENRLRSSL